MGNPLSIIAGAALLMAAITLRLKKNGLRKRTTTQAGRRTAVRSLPSQRQKRRRGAGS